MMEEMKKQGEKYEDLIKSLSIKHPTFTEENISVSSAETSMEFHGANT
jgi:hypothetical protein